MTTDAAAFPARSAGRKAWEVRVARPLSVRAALVTHLVVGEQIVSAVLLFRRARARFAPDEEAVLREVQPALSVCDAMHQLASSRELRGLRSRLRCVDQRLTPRQRDAVERVALGHTNREIGQALGLSPNTVRNLLTEARARVGAANRADLVRLAVLR